MSAKSINIGSDLNKIDAHVITADEYEEIPELTDVFFERSNVHQCGKLIRKGSLETQPKKVLVSVRYSPEVVAYFKSTGKGWQKRMDEALKEWLREHPVA